jgi:Glycine rich protein/RTX calcium-binding nonapeptide repeat (4 copies)
MNAGCVSRGSLRLAEVSPPRSRRSTFVRRAALALTSAMLATLALGAPASAATETFNFTGAAQTWTVPAGVTEATFDLYGAQGSGLAAGLGGRATATISVTPGASIQVNVGGQGGTLGAGGFNGGGNATPPDGDNIEGGGGASDIRIGGTALTDRLLVAGGGGGQGTGYCTGGSIAGGNGGGLSGLSGGNAACGNAGAAGGGTQTEGGGPGSLPCCSAQPGAFGVGGTGNVGGGGGGGWFGGGGGASGGGGGGSGHGPDGTVFQTGVRAGNGLVTVTPTPTIATLIQSVADLKLPPGLTTNLRKPLITAQNYLDAGRVAAACNQLASFISYVQARSGNKIPAADADDLIAEAEDVRESLNCGAGLTCAGQDATIAGTGQSDKLAATNGDDVIAAGGGDDTIAGRGGDDLVCGAGGDDRLSGKGGADELRGGAGDDEHRGGGGSDKCRGGRGSDSKHGC